MATATTIATSQHEPRLTGQTVRNTMASIPF